MPTRSVVLLAAGTQGALIALSWWATRALAIPIEWGSPLRDASTGVVVAAVLAAGNYYLLTRAPALWIVEGVRRVYRELMVPLFGGLSPAGVILIGALAGLGEEWFFRGVLQPLIGLPAAALLFGLAHVGGPRMVAFGLWAAAMGLIMGTLTIVTGGLIAAVVAHGVYDMLALEYIRRGARTE